MHISKSSLCWPNAGIISVSAFSKSSCTTETWPMSFDFEMSDMFTLRFNANDVAQRMSPSSSAPEKFLVCVARAGMETSLSRYPFSLMFLVWMLRISTRPFSSGRLISTCISRRPGRSKASSMRSMRFVIPITRRLLRASTPSIFESSWFTMLSWTPVLSRELPRDLQIESISSKITTCSWEFSPWSLYSFSASTKRLRMFSSAWPTYLFRISGPLTIFGSAAFRNLASCLAMSVFPVPGGPCSSIPRTWLMPRSRIMCGGKTRAAKARRKMSPNSFESPPMPSSAKLKSGRKMLRCCTLLLRTCSFPDGPCENSNSVCEHSMPLSALPLASSPSRTSGSRVSTCSLRTVPL
mmetsp:Transcript_87443/g.247958  ORF Transcript_87443/g.247958 Transcript_87443/m.247958 type:complete len:352 (+) Transcript_87443:838-1893(+)